MTSTLLALACVALACIGYVTGRRGSAAAAATTAVLLLGAAIAILVTRGEVQRVVAGGLVGLVIGHLVGASLRRREPQRSSDRGAG